jgi:hypothetical protein
MNRMIKARFPSSQSTALTDALVRAAISYLDSATNYREVLPRRPGARKRQFRLAVTNPKVAEYVGFGVVVLIAVAMVAILWFFE